MPSRKNTTFFYTTISEGETTWRGTERSSESETMTFLPLAGRTLALGVDGLEVLRVLFLFDLQRTPGNQGRAKPLQERDQSRIEYLPCRCTSTMNLHCNVLYDTVVNSDESWLTR